MSPIYGFWLVQALYPCVGLHSNTVIHVFWMLAAEVSERVFGIDLGLTPMLMSNACATSLSFHASWLLDRTVFRRHADKIGWSMTAYHLVSLLTHVFPVYHAWRRLGRPYRVLAWLRPEHAGFWTLYHHLSWALYRAGGMSLSNIYVPLTNTQWGILWAIAVMGHMVGCMIGYAHRAHGVVMAIASAQATALAT